MLRVEQVAKKIGRAVATTYEMSRKADFPPARKRIGVVKFWATEDINFWKRNWKDGRANNGRRRKRA